MVSSLIGIPVTIKLNAARQIATVIAKAFPILTLFRSFWQSRDLTRTLIDYLKDNSVLCLTIDF